METERLDLIAGSPQLLIALIEDVDAFHSAVGFRLAEGYRDFFVSDDFPEEWLDSVRARTKADPWHDGFFLVERESGLAIGSAGFKGPPDASGTVEIAYAVVPDFEGRGFATEAAEGVVRYAESTGEVRKVRAHTLPEANASTQVLAKCGFRHVGEVEDPEDGTVWRWEREVTPRPE